MELGIAGRRAAVAAATAGLGLGSAKALAAEGVLVAICGRTQARVDAAVAELGDDAVGIVADVSTPEGGRGFVEAAVDALGGVDILVANGGGPPAGNFASTAFELYEPAIAQNLLSIVAMTQAAVPAMQAQHWGRIVAITSVSVRQPIANLILSNTARAGVTGFLKTLSTEIAADGITVNSVQPGTHRTERIAHVYGADIDKAASTVPARIIGDADDFGATVAFLCSEQAKFITGVGLHVDGGVFAGLQSRAMFRHVVLLRFVPEATAEQRQAVLDGLATLPPLIPELRSYVFGPDAGISDGNYDLAVVADCDDVAGYQAYATNPTHLAVIAERVRPILAARAAVQYQVPG